MDTIKIEKRIKKIISVLEVFKEDNKISHLEKDLLLGYVRELYDLIRESDVDHVESKTHVENSMRSVPVTNTSNLQSKPIDVVEHQTINQVSQIEKQTEQLPKPVEAIKKEVQPVQAVDIKQVVSKKEEVKLVGKKPGSEAPLDLESLFKVEEVTDLAEKLSMSKIGDISKVIGINERIFIVAELFGGDKKFFDSTLSKLNSCVTFEEAKSIIIHEVAKPMEWEKEDRIKKAQHFVKQVRRKFS